MPTAMAVAILFFFFALLIALTAGAIIYRLSPEEERAVKKSPVDKRKSAQALLFIALVLTGLVIATFINWNIQR